MQGPWYFKVMILRTVYQSYLPIQNKTHMNKLKIKVIEIYCNFMRKMRKEENPFEWIYDTKATLNDIDSKLARIKNMAVYCAASLGAGS